MRDVLLLGSGSSLLQPDALEDFGVSFETGTEFEVQTRPFTPPYPASRLPVVECVFRRLYVVVVHRNGCALYLTPVVDGVPLTAAKRYFSRPALGQEERADFVLPFEERGTTIAALLEFEDPAARFHVQSIVVGYRLLSGLRARTASE